MEELGTRMSAMEFGEWQKMYANEEMHPVNAALRHAQLLATSMQGAVRRNDGRPWTAAHFHTDPWAPPAPVAKRRVNVVQQVRALNASRRRRS